MDKADKDKLWAGLDALGEDKVREKLGLGQYGDRRKRYVEEWLRQLDETKPKPKTPLHETTLGALLIIILGGLAVAGAVYWLGWN